MSEIIMNEVAISSHLHRTGDSEFSLAEGKMLKIETSPNGETIFNSSVPAGKVWEITVYLQINEI